MHDKPETLTIAEINIELTRKKIKTLRLAIHPPEGRVRISAPHRYTDSMILSFVTEKLDWIKRCQQKIRSRTDHSNFNYTSDEVHSILGNPSRLQVIERSNARAKVVTSGGTLELYIPAGSTQEQRKAWLEKWYRDQLKEALPMIIQRWSAILNVRVKEWAVKRMKTRWGTCNPKAQRIWLSLELAKYSVRSIEYVVCHELAHLLEPSHNQRFKNIMTEAMPDWKARRDELKRVPLG